MHKETDSNQEFPSTGEALGILFFSLFLTIFFRALTGEMDNKTAIIGTQIFFTIPFLVFIRIRNLDVRKALRLNPASRSILGISAGIGLGLGFVIKEFGRLLREFIPLPEEMQQSLEFSFKVETATDVLLLVFGVMILTAFLEEIVFRGFIQNAIEARMDITRAVLMTAFIFSIVYIGSPHATIQVIIIGVVLGALAWKSNSIFPAAVAHACINIVDISLDDTIGTSKSLFDLYGHINPLLLLASGAVLVYGIRLFNSVIDAENSPASS